MKIRKQRVLKRELTNRRQEIAKANVCVGHAIQHTAMRSVKVMDAYHQEINYISNELIGVLYPSFDKHISITNHGLIALYQIAGYPRTHIWQLTDKGPRIVPFRKGLPTA